MKGFRTHTLLLALALHASTTNAQVPPDAPPSAPSEAPTAPASEPAPSETPPAEAPAEPPPAEPPNLAPYPSASTEPPAGPPPTATFAPIPPANGAPPTTPPRTAAPPAAATAGAAASGAAQAQSSTAKQDDSRPAKDDQNGLLGPFRIGPIIGVGLPSLINVGGMLKLTKYFAAGVNIGIAPSVKFAYYGDATVTYHAYQLYAHVHPLGGGFYFGASLGYARARGTAEQVINLSPAVRMLFPNLGSSITLKSEGTVQTMVLTPELGYFKTWKSGFSFGVGAGLQIPVASSDVTFDQSVNADVPQEVLKQYLDPTARTVKDTLERVGQALIPTIGLSMGWLL